MTKLSVNLNKIALVRNARTLGIPSVIKAAKICINAGAYGITVHPRPDERHIRYSDVYELKPVVSGVEFNIEGNPLEGRYMEIMPDIRPTQATLVPDVIGAVTSDHGWDLNKENIENLDPIIKKLKELGIRISIFVDPVIETVEKAKEIGADRIELYTEPYARAFAEIASSPAKGGTPRNDISTAVARYAAAAEKAAQIGLGVNAGHDLNLDNLRFFCENVKPIMEVSIGHALIADALDMGLAEAVREYCKILESIK
ncbi:MAG: pyridoxine 5'-phosphate synthase [Planctomycetes bacterium HGW-Planctomycetes-1]|nr:MAG: pyridoxine 5'-phosphate synthase [Planctomycetes bacterium HGW-Planctomycetes-1]